MNNRTAFVLGSVGGAAMIVNRLDYDPVKKERGVSLDLLDDHWRDPALTALVCQIAVARRKQYGDGVVLIDGGANIGSYTIPWARFMAGWGEIIAFEPQRWPYYALCGNLALNNCFNVEARQQALAASSYNVAVPFWDPAEPHNFGGMTLINAHCDVKHSVPAVAIDEIPLRRLDILKLDLEGMEPAAIRGAKNSLREYGPVIIAEGHICGDQTIADLLPGYTVIGIGPDVLCVPAQEQNAELLSAIDAFAKAQGRDLNAA